MSPEEWAQQVAFAKRRGTVGARLLERVYTEGSDSNASICEMKDIGRRNPRYVFEEWVRRWIEIHQDHMDTFDPPNWPVLVWSRIVPWFRATEGMQLFRQSPEERAAHLALLEEIG